MKSTTKCMPGAPSVKTKIMTKPGFPDHVYAQAADVFRASCMETNSEDRTIRYSPIPHPATREAGGVERNAKQNELCAYELAFNTLKFQLLLEDVLIDSCYQVNQQLPDDLMALAMVMLYDIHDRKFQPRQPITGEGEGSIEDVRLVEESLYRFRTKLVASLARFRIKHDLVCIKDFLPIGVKEKHQRKDKLHICTWVNTLKSSVDEVCVMLKTEGFVQVDPNTHLEGSVFCRDTHCPDVLQFPHQAEECLEKMTLIRDHILIIQEKSRSLAVCALRPLLAKKTDILIVGSFSHLTVAHVGVQASVFSNQVFVCGLLSDSAHREELQQTLSLIGCKNVRLLAEQFSELSDGDSRLQKVQVVLVLPRCTASALNDPIAHIINENGDRKLLQDLSQGAVSDMNLESLVQKQIQYLCHALTFPRVHGVVYCTCSVHADENELVVKRAIKNTAVRTKSRLFRISTGWTDDKKFLRLQASDTSEGCFLCVLKREETESIQDILERAVAKGLLNGVALPEKVKQTKTKEKRTGAPGTSLPPPPPPFQPAPSITSDPSTSENPHTLSTVPLGAHPEHTQDSLCPSPTSQIDISAHRNGVESQAPKARRKKARRRKNIRGAKAKSGTTLKRKTRRIKPPRVQPV